jgi:hypothetical protein
MVGLFISGFTVKGLVGWSSRIWSRMAFSTYLHLTSWFSFPSGWRHGSVEWFGFVPHVPPLLVAVFLQQPQARRHELESSCLHVFFTTRGIRVDIPLHILSSQKGYYRIGTPGVVRAQSHQRSSSRGQKHPKKLKLFTILVDNDDGSSLRIVLRTTFCFIATGTIARFNVSDQTSTRPIPRLKGTPSQTGTLLTSGSTLAIIHRHITHPFYLRRYIQQQTLAVSARERSTAQTSASEAVRKEAVPVLMCRLRRRADDALCSLYSPSPPRALQGLPPQTANLGIRSAILQHLYR